MGKLFEDFYVVKDGATDCSFVAALMLMLRRDPAYPYRILRETPEGYTVRFPGLVAPISVSREDLRIHHENWNRTRETYRRFWRGNIPEGLEILRCAYYNYQAQAGIRGGKGTVHSGGIPSHDLMVLSGARTSTTLLAHCPQLGDQSSFYSCPGRRLETRMRWDGTFSSRVTGPPREIGDPLDFLGNPEAYLVVLSSSSNVPRWWGPHIIPGHAYYYLAKTADGRYVLGNSYQTRRPITVTSVQLRKYFRAIDLIELS